MRSGLRALRRATSASIPASSLLQVQPSPGPMAICEVSLATSIPTFTDDSDMGFLLPTLRDAGFEPRQLSGMKDDNRRDDPCSPAVFFGPRAGRSVTTVETLSKCTLVDIQGWG